MNWREIRDHDAEFWAAFLSAVVLALVGYVARVSGEYMLATACGWVAIGVFVVLCLYSVPRLIAGR